MQTLEAIIPPLQASEEENVPHMQHGLIMLADGLTTGYAGRGKGKGKGKGFFGFFSKCCCTKKEKISSADGPVGNTNQAFEVQTGPISGALKPVEQFLDPFGVNTQNSQTPTSINSILPTSANTNQGFEAQTGPISGALEPVEQFLDPF